MIDPQTIRKKARSYFDRAVEAWLSGNEEIFPWRVPCDLKPPSDVAAAREQLDALREASIERRSGSYRIQWEPRTTRRLGKQNWPAAVYFDSLDDLANFAGLGERWRTLQSVRQKLTDCDPRLSDWLAAHWKTACAVAEDIGELLIVLEFLASGEAQGRTVRELPLPVSSKLVERHLQLLEQWLVLVAPHQVQVGAVDPAHRLGLRRTGQHYLVRFMDEQLRRIIGCMFDELSLPLATLERLPVRDVRVLFIENETLLLSLPPLPRTIAISGIGYAVRNLMKLPWLAGLPLAYWGDMDFDGFAILDMVRGEHANVASFLMDEWALERYWHLTTSHATNRSMPLARLSASEAAALRRCQERGVRLEQNRIPIDSVVAMWAEQGGLPSGIER